MSHNERSPLLPGRGGPRRRSSVAAARDLDRQPTTVESFRSLVFYSPINVLLLAVPFSFASHFAGWGATPTFITSFLAIVPLAGLLGEATEQVSLRLGQTLGGLLNATFGNAVEAIVAIIALQQNQLRIVQTSMLGSVLSNLLLVLGCAFWAAGKNFKQAKFRVTAAQTSCSILMLAGATLILPAAYHASSSNKAPLHTGLDPQAALHMLAKAGKGPIVDPMKDLRGLLVLSRATSIILLLMYIAYLYFQLKSHADLFEAEVTPNGEEEEEEVAKMNIYSAIAALVLVTLVTAFCADYLVESIDEFSTKVGVPKIFVGAILLPIVGNAAEHFTAVLCAYKGKMEIALGVAIGSSIQIAVGLLPILVLIGWAIGRDLTLYFGNFETICLFLSVLLVNLVLGDGLSNYLEGIMLVALYVVIAVAFWVY